MARRAVEPTRNAVTDVDTDRSRELADLRDKVAQLAAAQRKGRWHRRRTVVLAVIGGLMAAVGAGTAAYASIPGPDGNITACVTSATGAVRIIDTANQTCSTSETKVLWGGGMHARGTYS